MPIDSFISEAGGDPKSFFNMAAKIHWVEKHCEQSISWDGGKPGVLKALHSDGRKRVNIGMRSGTTKRQDGSWSSVTVSLHHRNRSHRERGRGRERERERE